VKAIMNKRITSSRMLHRVTVVRTDVSEELSASIIRMTRIGELGTTLALTRNRRTLRRNISKRRFLQEPHGVTSQKTAYLQILVCGLCNKLAEVQRVA
jgi:hypothetical protein